jgi:hypothetical protein
MALHAYINVLKRIESSTQFSGKDILMTTDHNEYWVHKYEKILRQFVYVSVDTDEETV